MILFQISYAREDVRIDPFSNILGQRADRIEDAEDHDSYVGEDGQPHVCNSEGAENKAEEFYADREPYIFVDDTDAFTGDADRLGNFSGIIIHEDDICGFDRGIGTKRSHCNSDVSS